MVASSEKANNIAAFDENASNLISSFKDLVVNYNTDDPFLKISSASIETWMDKNPEDDIVFGSNNFELLISKVIQLVISLGGIVGEWPNDIPDNDFEVFPQVNFSKEILTRQAPSPNKNVKAGNSSSSYISDEKQKKADFIKSSLVDDDLNTPSSSNSSSFLRWLFIIIGIILLLLLLRNCSISRDAEYYYKRGVGNAESGKYDKASRDFDNAINIDRIEPYMARGE